MSTHGKEGTTYHEKDICDRRNVSVKLPCVFECLSSGDLLIFFGKSLLFLVPIFSVKCKRAWSLTLREERRLRIFENRILRRVFGPKRDENGEWRRLYNEELHTLYCLIV